MVLDFCQHLRGGESWSGVELAIDELVIDLTVTVRCNLFLDSLSHVDDASSVKIIVGAGAHVDTNS